MVGRLRRWYKCLDCRTRIVITVDTTGEWVKVDTTAGPVCPVCRTGGSNMLEVDEDSYNDND